MVKVSVIVPVYNAEKYLDACVSSLVNQSLRECEFIFIDDESSDSSLEMLKKYASEDDRITVISQPHSNAGVARNRGLDIAKGEYLTFLDADDYFKEGALSDSYEFAKKNDTDIVIFGGVYCNNETGRESPNTMCINEKFLSDKEVYSSLELRDAIFQVSANWVWNKLFRREMIEEKGIRFQDVGRSNDVCFAMCAMSCADSIGILRKELVAYRKGHGQNMQANNRKDPEAFWKAYEGTYEALQRLHGEDFESFRSSFYVRALSSFFHYVRSMKDDHILKNYLLDMIIYKGEDLYHFSSYDESFYKSDADHVFALYMDFYELAKKDPYDKIKADQHYLEYRIGSFFTFLPKKIRNLFICLKHNGFVYTVKRTLFHLHLAQDNDPARTASEKLK